MTIQRRGASDTWGAERGCACVKKLVRAESSRRSSQAQLRSHRPAWDSSSRPLHCCWDKDRIPGVWPLPASQAHLLSSPVKEEAEGVQRPQGASVGDWGRTDRALQAGPSDSRSEPGRLSLEVGKLLAVSCAPKAGWVKVQTCSLAPKQCSLVSFH